MKLFFFVWVGAKVYTAVFGMENLSVVCFIFGMEAFEDVTDGFGNMLVLLTDSNERGILPNLMMDK